MPFQVIFEGLNENSPEEKERVKEKLVEKFKVPLEKADRMVNSTPIVVKKGLTQEQAAKYKSALDTIGVRSSIRLVVEEGESGKENAPAPAKDAATVVAPAQEAAKASSNAATPSSQPEKKDI